MTGAMPLSKKNKIMGTRSVTRIHSGNLTSPVLVSIYQQYDGYFEGVGQELVDFCKNYRIVNGLRLGGDSEGPIANGMGCFAAQLIAHLKKEPGQVYITSAEDVEEYNYDIYVTEVDNWGVGTGKLSIQGRGYDETKQLLGGSDALEKQYTEVAEFEYVKDGQVSHRKIGVCKRTNDYIEGLDLDDDNKYKKFSSASIVGGIEHVKFTDSN